MSKKVYIGDGHGGSDPGAVKYLVEKDVNLKMALACKDYLLANGVEVKISRENDKTVTIATKVSEANNFGADLALDIHNNAGGGDGAEVYHSIAYGTGKQLADNILEELKKIGQNSRGAKIKKNSSGSDYFGFIRSTKMPAVICEGVFVDNKADASQADTDEECKAFGVAYAKAILKTLGINSNSAPTPKPTTPDPKPSNTNGSFRVKVSIGNLNIRKGPGTNYDRVNFITPGVYTIVETKSGVGSANGWGRLKSGAGWIALDYAKRL